MTRLKFKPRKTFLTDLKRLALLDTTIVPEVRAAIDLLLESQTLPAEFDDHELTRRMTGYREFHLRDTPNGTRPSESNDVLIVYAVDATDLILVGIRAGSHQRLFGNQNSAKRYRK